MAAGGGGDVSFNFETNIEDPVARILRGIQEVAGAARGLDASAGQGGQGKFLEGYDKRIDTLLRKLGELRDTQRRALETAPQGSTVTSAAAGGKLRLETNKITRKFIEDVTQDLNAELARNPASARTATGIGRRIDAALERIHSDTEQFAKELEAIKTRRHLTLRGPSGVGNDNFLGSIQSRNEGAGRAARVFREQVGDRAKEMVRELDLADRELERLRVARNARATEALRSGRGGGVVDRDDVPIPVTRPNPKKAYNVPEDQRGIGRLTSAPRVTTANFRDQRGPSIDYTVGNVRARLEDATKNNDVRALFDSMSAFGSARTNSADLTDALSRAEQRQASATTAAASAVGNLIQQLTGLTRAAQPVRDLTTALTGAYHIDPRRPQLQTGGAGGRGGRGGGIIRPLFGADDFGFADSGGGRGRRFDLQRALFRNSRDYVLQEAALQKDRRNRRDPTNENYDTKTGIRVVSSAFQNYLYDYDKREYRDRNDNRRVTDPKTYNDLQDARERAETREQKSRSDATRLLARAAEKLAADDAGRAGTERLVAGLRSGEAFRLGGGYYQDNSSGVPQFAKTSASGGTTYLDPRTSAASALDYDKALKRSSDLERKEAERQQRDAQRSGALQARAEREDRQRTEAQQRDAQRSGQLQARAEREDRQRTEAKQREDQRAGSLQARAEREDRQRTESQQRGAQRSGVQETRAYRENQERDAATGRRSLAEDLAYKVLTEQATQIRGNLIKSGSDFFETRRTPQGTEASKITDTSQLLGAEKAERDYTRRQRIAAGVEQRAIARDDLTRAQYENAAALVRQIRSGESTSVGGNIFTSPRANEVYKQLPGGGVDLLRGDSPDPLEQRRYTQAMARVAASRTKVEAAEEELARQTLNLATERRLAAAIEAKQAVIAGSNVFDTSRTGVLMPEVYRSLGKGKGYEQLTRENDNVAYLKAMQQYNRSTTAKQAKAWPFEERINDRKDSSVQVLTPDAVKVNGGYFDRATGDALQAASKQMTRALVAEAALSDKVRSAEEQRANYLQLRNRQLAGQARHISGNLYEDNSRGPENPEFYRLTPQGARAVRPDTFEHERALDQSRSLKPQSITQGFLRGVGSAGFGGGTGGFNPAGLAQAAGNTVKYSVLYDSLNLVQQALQQTLQEILNFDDSLANLELAYNGAGEASRAFMTDLQDIAQVAGVNLGDVMDQAAIGMRAFGDAARDATGAVDTDKLEAFGAKFAKGVAVNALITGNTYDQASSDVRASASAFAGSGSTGALDVNGQISAINDAIAGAKEFGGDAKDISKGTAALAVSASTAGLEINQIAAIVSQGTARLGESGELFATRFSRVLAIMGGSEGQSAIAKINQLLPSEYRVDSNAPVATQALQLSQAYNARDASGRQVLTDDDLQPFVSSLGGGANSREFLTFIRGASDTLGGSLEYTGKAMDEYGRRVANLVGTIERFQGALREFITQGVVESGVIDPLIKAFGALVKTTEALTGGITFVITGFEGLNEVINTYVVDPIKAFAEPLIGAGEAVEDFGVNIIAIGAAIAGALLLVKGANALRNAGGLRNAVTGQAIRAERILRPEGALAREELNRRNLIREGATAEGRNVRRGTNASGDRDGQRQLSDAERARAQRRRDAQFRDVTERRNNGNPRPSADPDAAARRRAAQRERLRPAREVRQDPANRELTNAERRRQAGEFRASAIDQQSKVAAAQQRLKTARREARGAEDAEAAQQRVTAAREDLARQQQLERRMINRANLARDEIRRNPDVERIRRPSALTRRLGGEPERPNPFVGRLPTPEAPETPLTRRQRARNFGASTRELGRDARQGLNSSEGAIGALLIGAGALYGAVQSTQALVGTFGFDRERSSDGAQQILEASVDTARIGSSAEATLESVTALRQNTEALHEASAAFLGIPGFFNDQFARYFGNQTSGQQERMAGLAADAQERFAAQQEAYAANPLGTSEEALRAPEVDLSSTDNLTNSIKQLQDSGAGAASVVSAVGIALGTMSEAAKAGTVVLNDQQKQLVAQSGRASIVGSLARNNETIDRYALRLDEDQVARDAAKAAELSGENKRFTNAATQARYNQQVFERYGYTDNITRDDAGAPQERYEVSSSRFQELFGEDKGAAAKLSNAEIKSLQDISETTLREQLDAGMDINTDEGRRLVTNLLSERLTKTMDGLGLSSESALALATDVVADAQKVGADYGNVDLADIGGLMNAISPTLSAQAERRGTTTSLDRTATQSGALAQAQENLRLQQTFYDEVLAQQTDAINGLDVSPEEKTAKLATLRSNMEQQAQRIEDATLAVQKQVVAQIQASTELAVASMPDQNQAAILDRQVAGLESVLATQTDFAERQATTAAAIQAAKQASAARAADTAARGLAAIDPESDIAYGNAQVTNARAALARIQQGYTVDVAGNRIAIAGDQRSAAEAQAREAVREAEKNVAARRQAADLARQRAGLVPEQVLEEDAIAITAARAELDRLAAISMETEAYFNALAAWNEAVRKQAADQVARDLQAMRSALAPEQVLALDAVEVNAARAEMERLAAAAPNSEAYYAAVGNYNDLVRRQAANVVQRDLARARANLRPEDTLALDAIEVEAARAEMERIRLIDPNSQAFFEAVAAYNAALKRQADDIGARDFARTLAGIDPRASMARAQAELTEGQRILATLQFDTQAYWEQYAKNVQAMIALADAQRAARYEAALRGVDITNDVATAQADAETAMQAYRDAVAQGAPAEVTDPLMNDARRKQFQAENAAFQQQLSDMQINDELGRITHAEYLNYLSNQHDRLKQQLAAMNEASDGYRQTVDQLNQIDQLLQAAKKAVNQQFNLQDATLPTLYEVRRAVGVSADQIRSQVVDYSSTQGTVIINGADMAQVVAYINKTLGTGSTAIYTTSPRRV